MNRPLDKITAELEELNQLFGSKSPVERLQLLYQYFGVEEVLFTSSFGTKSALLLYWMSNIQPAQVVHFLDTGYHFKETLNYIDQLQAAFQLKLAILKPDQVQHAETAVATLWEKQPSKCCYINKVLPLEGVKQQYKVWISGLMRHQTNQRADLSVFEYQDGLLKFYPLIDLPQSIFEQAYTEASLPPHPLQLLGYQSIGCLHCTQRGEGRSGRWKGSNKTECGLHFN